jgi:hypothetical protein
MTNTITIATDFSDVPSGRFREDGDFNGERFREDYLVPFLEKNEVVHVVLDGAEGYGSSFLEEAFGGLIRAHGYTKDFLSTHLRIVAKSARAQRYKSIVERFIHDALGAGRPVGTA